MSRPILFYVPAGDLAVAIGVLAARHGHLEYTLRMTVKSVENLSIADALRDTQWWTVKRVRERILKGAETRLGQGDALSNISDFLNRAATLSGRRNRFIHGLYAQELDGRLVFCDQGPWEQLPSASEVKALADQIGALTDEINDARLQGWLKQAIEAAA